MVSDFMTVRRIGLGACALIIRGSAPVDAAPTAFNYLTSQVDVTPTAGDPALKVRP